jgi:hypothetical protein
VAPCWEYWLDGISKRSAGSGNSGENRMEAMLGVIADLGDPVAEQFTLLGAEVDCFGHVETLGGGLEHPISPVVLALAIKQLFASQVFEPSPAEVRRACIKAYRQVRRIVIGLQSLMDIHSEVIEVIGREGTPAERKEWRRTCEGFDEYEDEDEDEDAP